MPKRVEEVVDEDGQVVTKIRVPKITPATVNARPERCKLLTPPGPVTCFVLIGEAFGLIEKEKDAQTFFGLVGKFEATNNETSEIFTSGVCYLPGGMHEMVTATLQKDPKAVVQFAIEIIATPSNNPRGYSWLGKDIAVLDKIDPLAHIKARINPKLVSASYVGKLQLPAPEEVRRLLADARSMELTNEEAGELIEG